MRSVKSFNGVYATGLTPFARKSRRGLWVELYEVTLVVMVDRIADPAELIDRVVRLAVLVDRVVRLAVLVDRVARLAVPIDRVVRLAVLVDRVARLATLPVWLAWLV